MRRETSLINDPNSMFAISRALRKQIVETDPIPQNRNNAIRDEKHIAYKSSGKEGYESFKYDILTSLEQLDNYFLELETVLGKITSDEDALKLQQEVRKQKTPAKRRGRPPKAKGAEEITGAGYKGGKRCCFNSSYCNGTAHYRNPRMRGGSLPDLPYDATIFNALKTAIKSSSVSDTLKKILKFYLSSAEAEKGKFEVGMIDSTEFGDIMDALIVEIRNMPDLKADKLKGTDEEDALEDLNRAFQEYIINLPDVEDVSLAEDEPSPAPAVSLKKRRAIPILTGNEFIVSTLSKINLLLIKLIAEYNGKILVNYKKFLQSDLEEIALKVIDSQRRFLELKNYLKDYEEGTKAVNISKFLSTIEQNFNKFIALTSRSIANFVNPNIQYLPNFSQQLSPSYQDPKVPFNLYQQTELQKVKDFDTKIDKLVTQYMKYNNDFEKERDTSYQPIKEKIMKYDSTVTKYEDKLRLTGLSEREKANLKILIGKRDAKIKELTKSTRRLDALRDKMDEIEAKPEYAFFPRGVV